VSSPLSAVPIDKRRRLAATLGLFAALFLVIGAVTATDAATVALKVFAGVAFVAGVVLAMMSWGVVTSIRQAAGERRLDAAVQDALAAAPPAVRRQFSCGCGQEHDPTEMHIVDAEPTEAAEAAEACAHDGTGTGCTHNCDTCALAALRPAPAAPMQRADRAS
jgi:hypothetical protein